MQSDLDVLRDVFTRLESAGIALNQYAQPRMTRDIDIVVMLQETDDARLVHLFEAEYYVPVAMVLTSRAAQLSVAALLQQVSSKDANDE